jgi:DNA-binding response OmpR family regulator
VLLGGNQHEDYLQLKRAEGDWVAVKVGRYSSGQTRIFSFNQKIMKILLVEDDPLTGLALLESLAERQYHVKLVTDGETGLQLAQTSNYDLVMLDVILPKQDGVSICRHLRAQGYERPILLLTAKDSSSDRVLGLDAGADDYVVKPFDLPELLARIRAVLRRGKATASSVIMWENLRFDPEQNEVTCGDRLLHLTPKEYCVLELFLLNPKRIFSRSAILDRLWDFAESPGEETVSSHIYSLRQKLKAAGAADLIETVHGLGYRLKAPTPNALAPDSGSAAPNPAKRQSSPKLAKTWAKFQPKLSAQIVSLEKMANALVAGHLSVLQQQQAEQTAHKLAGSLGIFGWLEGSHLARALETVLQQPGLTSVQVTEVVEVVRALRQGFHQRPLLSPALPAAQHPERETSALLYAPQILIVDDDLWLAEHLRTEAARWEMRVEVATDLAVARAMIAKSPPNAILLDLNFPQSTEDGLTLLRELAIRLPRIPVLVFTARESLVDRVKAVHLGGCAFLHKPLPTHQILQAVTEVLHQTRPPVARRILVVDENATEVANITALLQPWAIEVTALTQPQEFWQVLTTVMPQLLMVDWELPSFNSMDLCQIVRHDSQWKDLPIVVFTAQTDLTVMQQAFAAGASDLIQKPMANADLVTRIVSRLKGVSCA